MGHILITGSEGFLGRAICKALRAGGHRISRFDKELGFNVANATDLKNFVRGSDATIHLGAPCSTRMFVERPQECWSETVIGMENVLKYCSGRIIFPSSGTIYGNSTVPIAESNELPGAPNLYAASKAECERLCLRAASEGKDVCILRIFTAYGPGEITKGDYTSALMHFIRAANEGKRPTVFGDGEQVRDFIFIDDVVGFILAALSARSNERVFNIGTGVGTSFLKTIKIIAGLTNQELRPIFITEPAGYVASIIANTQRVMKELGYQAKVSIEEGIAQTLESLRNAADNPYGDRRRENTNWKDLPKTKRRERRMTDFVNSLPQSLLNAVKSRTCVPFVGSGLSLDFGMPTWRELIERLANRCESDCKDSKIIVALLEEGEYLDAVEWAKNKLGKQIYCKVLKDAFGKYEGNPADGLHPLIWAMDPPMVITTNFDTLLEDSITPRPNVVTHLDRIELLDLFRRPKNKVLFKVHGTISNIKSIVLSADDYRRLYQTDMNAFNLAFTQPLLTNTLLFIGFGMSDKGVLAMLSSSADLFDGFTGNHYAFMKRGDAEVRELWNEYGVNVVEYDDHNEIKDILSELRWLMEESKDTHGAGGVRAEKLTVSPRAGTRVVVGPSDTIPESLRATRRRAFGECIFLLHAVGRKGLRVWQHGHVQVYTRPVYYRPTQPLEEVQRSTLAHYERIGTRTSPRLSLVDLQLEPKGSFRYGDITIHADLTDWALVDGIQRVLATRQEPYFEEISGRFWASVESLVTERQSVEFPHHLAVHCLVISGDNKVILNRRAGVSNQRGRVSASFEEQMLSPHM